MELRPGRRAGRTLYLVTGDNPDQHKLIGLVDTPELARAICDAVNRRGHTGVAAAAQTLADEGRRIWGHQPATLADVVARAAVILGDLARMARAAEEGTPADPSEVGRELGNLTLSTARWAADLGLDPAVCIRDAIACQQRYVAAHNKRPVLDGDGAAGGDKLADGSRP